MKRDETLSSEDLKKLSKDFMDKSVQANCTFELIKQYSKEFKEYHEAIRVSAAFYNTVQNSLVESTLIKLALIFDRDSHAVNINHLIDNMIANDYSACFNTEIQEGLAFQGKTALDELKNVRKNYRQIESIVEKLFKQRTKIYAHSDFDTITNGYDSIISKNGLYFEEVDSLLNYAIEASQMTESLLTGISRAKGPVNIDDWKNTLWLVQNGMKYEEQEHEFQMKEAMKNTDKFEKGSKK